MKHTELIERLRAGSGGMKHWQELESEAADAIESLQAEVERLTSDRNLEKKLRKDSEERAYNAESDRDALKLDAERYRWLTNRVLCPDYGDNDTEGEKIGWRIVHNLLANNGLRQPAFMYGLSIDAAIDAEMKGTQK